MRSSTSTTGHGRQQRGGPSRSLHRAGQVRQPAGRAEARLVDYRPPLPQHRRPPWPARPAAAAPGPPPGRCARWRHAPAGPPPAVPRAPAPAAAAPAARPGHRRGTRHRTRQRRAQRTGQAQRTPLLVRQHHRPHLVAVPARRVDRRQARRLGRRTHPPRRGRPAQQPMAPLAQLRPRAPAARAVHRQHQPGDLPPPAPHDSTVRAPRRTTASHPFVSLWKTRKRPVQRGGPDAAAQTAQRGRRTAASPVCPSGFSPDRPGWCPSARSASSSRPPAAAGRPSCRTTRAAAASGPPTTPPSTPGSRPATPCAAEPSVLMYSICCAPPCSCRAPPAGWRPPRTRTSRSPPAGSASAGPSPRTRGCCSGCRPARSGRAGAAPPALLHHERDPHAVRGHPQRLDAPGQLRHRHVDRPAGAVPQHHQPGCLRVCGRPPTGRRARPSSGCSARPSSCSRRSSARESPAAGRRRASRPRVRGRPPARRRPSAGHGETATASRPALVSPNGPSTGYAFALSWSAGSSRS